jgi:hypothetical protein
MDSFKRENALFQGSRLYRQATEGSDFLKQELLDDRHPFQSVVERLSGNGEALAISELADCKKAIATLRPLIDQASKAASPYIAIPVLIQAITEYYSEGLASKAAWLGTALKVALASVWSNVHEGDVAQNRSLAALPHIVRMAGALEQLEITQAVLENYGEGQVELRGDGPYPLDDKTYRGFIDLRETYKLRGKVFRTSEQTKRAVLDRPDLAMDAILNILRGDDPRDQPVFANTLLGELTREEPREFWGSLFARLFLMGVASIARAHVTNDLFGVSLIEASAWEYPTAESAVLLQRSMEGLFWTREWYERMVDGSATSMNNLILSRPILRVASNVDLFATSPPFIWDSINWFIEESVMRYEGRGGVPLSESVFNRLVSAPFETTIRDLFRGQRFLAGRVTQKGACLIEEGESGASEVLLGKKGDQSPALVHLAGEKCPGEMDVVAYHRSKAHLVVVECKVLGFPFALRRIGNIAQKIGEADAEAFHAKLRRKIAWLRSTDVFSRLPVRGVSGMIVLDRKLPGMEGGEFTVADAETLRSVLEEFVAQAY